MNATAGNLQVINGGAMPTLNLSNDQKLHAVRQTVAKNASDEEFAMFMHLANTYQLDPFLKEIWFIKYNNSSPTIMVSRDGLRNYAQRQGDLQALISQEVRQGDTFKLNPITGEIHHEISDGSGPITKAYAIVKREGKPDHIEVVDFQEYYQALSGKNAVWKSHPSAMIKKVAEVLALKKCYTITGLYAPEEMGLQEPIDITSEANNWQQGGGQVHGDTRYNQPSQPQHNAGGGQHHNPQGNGAQGQGTGANGPSQAQVNYMHKLKNDKGINDEDYQRMMAEMCNGKTSSRDLTKQEASAFINFLNAYQPPQIVTDEKPLDLNDADLPF